MPRKSLTLDGADFGGRGRAVGDDFAGHFAADVLDFALEAADAGFVRVVTNDVHQAFVGEAEIFVGEAGGFASALDEEALGDLQLFLFGVAGDAQDFHAVLQGLRNGVQNVGGADEHDLGKVVFDVEIVIGEGVIELGIENFHQGGRWVAAEVHRHLVDFIENEDRVDGAGLLHHLDDLTGQGADVGTAMAANFGLIAHAAKRNADELAAGGVADGHRERSFADAWRSDEAENRAFRIFYELADGEKFEDAVFDLVEAVVLFVENFFGGADVANFLGFFLPGHSEQPVEIIAADGGFRGHRRHQFQALELLDRLLVDVFRHAGGVDLFLELVDFVFFAAAEFLLDGLELFVEVVLFLGALHLALHAGIDVAIDVELFEFDFEDVADAVEALDGIDGLEQVLLFVNGKLEVRGDGVGEARGIVDAGRGDHGVVVERLRKLDELFVEAGDFLDGLIDGGEGSTRAFNRRTVARKKPSSVAMDSARARSTPSTKTLMLPSGSLTLWTMLASVPTA